MSFHTLLLKMKRNERTINATVVCGGQIVYCCTLVYNYNITTILSNKLFKTVFLKFGPNIIDKAVIGFSTF
jgi:hypothetical protein